MSAFQQSKEQQNALRGPIPSLYAQDTFHTTPRLTLVGGVRWGPNFMPVDYYQPWSGIQLQRFRKQHHLRRGVSECSGRHPVV